MSFECGCRNHLFSVRWAAMIGPLTQRGPSFPSAGGCPCSPSQPCLGAGPISWCDGPQAWSGAFTLGGGSRWFLVKALSTTVFYKAFYKRLLYFLRFLMSLHNLPLLTLNHLESSYTIIYTCDLILNKGRILTKHPRDFTG